MKQRQIQEQEKKVKKAPQPKKAPKSPEFIETDDSSKEKEEDPPQDDKGKKNTPFTGTDRRVNRRSVKV